MGSVDQDGHLGLYDGFEAYKTVSDDDYRTLLKRALVVVDTNVLLNLYRYNAATRSSVVEVLTALGDRLWIPHQVVVEFWRNRERALVSPLAEVAESVSNLRKHCDQIAEVLHQWVNRANLGEEEVAEVTSELDAVLSRASGLIESMVDEEAVHRARSTDHDMVLTLLAPVLNGRVGRPMDEHQRTAAVKEGQRRVSAGLPPGFADAKKDNTPDGAAGDYLVWEQTLIEAERRRVDVLFVTGDVKRDWWRYEGNYARGPHVDLVRELRSRSGTTLYMMRPDRLLALADAVSVKVDEDSVTNIERATRSATNDETAPSATGWDRTTLEVLLRQLARVAPVQEAVIRYAAGHDGYVSRDEVYEIGDYGPERQLKGFTRPVNRLVQEMRDSGDLSADTEDLLAPVYDEGRYGFGWVDGYRIHPDVAALVRSL